MSLRRCQVQVPALHTPLTFVLGGGRKSLQHSPHGNCTSLPGQCTKPLHQDSNQTSTPSLYSESTPCLYTKALHKASTTSLYSKPLHQVFTPSLNSIDLAHLRTQVISTSRHRTRELELSVFWTNVILINSTYTS